MTDYIKKDLERIIAYASAIDIDAPTWDEQKERLKAVQTADVAPVRHGRWDVIDAEEPRRYGCSECKRLSWYMENYCPNCGAKMDEEAES